MSIFDVMSGQPVFAEAPGPQAVPVDAGYGYASSQEDNQINAAPIPSPQGPVGMPPPPQMGMEDALVWHNQALMNRLGEAEQRLAAIRPLENLLQNDPGAYTRVLHAIQGGAPTAPTAPTAAPAQAPIVADTLPWEEKGDGPPVAQAQTIAPDTLLKAQATLMHRQMAPVQQEINQLKVAQANISLEKELARLSQTYGPDFNPREVVAYALSRNTTDLDQAFRWVIGEKAFRQRYMGQEMPGPQQSGMPQPPVRYQGPVAYQGPPPPARVEPARGRVAAPQVGAVPPGYVARDYSEAANVALSLLRQSNR